MDGLSDKAAAFPVPPEPSAPHAPGLEEVRKICTLLEEHKGGAVTGIDLRELHSWTDYFVIATVSSGTHLQGLVRRLKEFAAEQGLVLFRGQGKHDSGGDWSLLDMGTAVIHLMSAQAREFYELEELWSSAGRIYP